MSSGKSRMLSFYLSTCCLLYCINIVEEFEGTDGVIRSVNRKGTDNTMASRKRTNNNLQDIYIITKHLAIRSQ